MAVDYRFIQNLYDEIQNWSEVRRRTGISPTTISRAKRKGLLKETKPKIVVVINHEEAQIKYDDGYSLSDLAKHYSVPISQIRKLKLVMRKGTEAQINRFKHKPPSLHSKETKEKLSKIRSESLNNNAFYSKRSVYKGITLDSSYEVSVAKELDKNDIRWLRPKSLKWKDNDQIRRYLPDFYLLDFDVYLDPKNDFLIKKDERKIRLAEEFNNVRIIVLDKS